MIRRWKKYLLWAGGVVLSMLLFVAWVNISMITEMHPLVYRDIHQVPSAGFAIVLGTSNKISTGARNNYFYYRIDAAADLYFSGKVKKVLLSGDNGQKYYNEPIEMKEALMDRGVPKKDIILDYAGFRTLDTMVRAGEVFGVDSAIVVTQEFHLPRALYLGSKQGMVVYGYAAKSPSGHYRNTRMSIREWLARVSAFLDVQVLHTRPRYLGSAI